MQIEKIRCAVSAVVAIVFVASSPTSFADCKTSRSATSVDIAGGQAQSLLGAIVAACKGQDPSKFFSLQTEDANKILAPSSKAEKKEIFSQYCAFTAEAERGLGGNIGAGVHSIGPYKSKTKCGAPSSYWFVHNKAGQLVLRLEVAVEAGRLKVDTH